MTEWVTVTPLTDEPADVSFWHQPEFKVGDRVRVRLSGECQHIFSHSRLDDSRSYEIEPHGHWLDLEQGRVGVIAQDIRTHPDWRPTMQLHEHYWGVEFDDPEWPLAGCAYAACELEHIDP